MLYWPNDSYVSKQLRQKNMRNMCHMKADSALGQRTIHKAESAFILRRLCVFFCLSCFETYEAFDSRDTYGEHTQAFAILKSTVTQSSLSQVLLLIYHELLTCSLFLMLQVSPVTGSMSMTVLCCSSMATGKLSRSVRK